MKAERIRASSGCKETEQRRRDQTDDWKEENRNPHHQNEVERVCDFNQVLLMRSYGGNEYCCLLMFYAVRIGDVN